MEPVSGPGRLLVVLVLVAVGGVVVGWAGGWAGGWAEGCDSNTMAFVTPPGVSPIAPDVMPRGRAGCIPNCRGKSCGSDGCSGHCGRCAKGRICLADRCTKNTTRELCGLVAGRWQGVMQARPLHYLAGRIVRQGKVCRGTFKVSYNLPRKGRAWVVQEFVITFTGTYMRMRGVRISAKSSNSSYNLDRFAGHLSRKLTRFSGRNRDVRGSASSFYLDRK